MPMRISARGSLTMLAVLTAGWLMLGLYRPGTAAPPPKEPFANAVEQRAEMIEQLRAVVAELKEQNALLKSGALQVIVAPDKKP
jgi:hypothetical protein